MNIDNLLKKFSKQKVQDYSYAILFFLVFSLFLFLIIRPNIITIFQLRSEFGRLQEVDDVYNKVIARIVDLQSTIEQTRDTIHVLDEALPSKPNVNALIQNIREAEQDSGVTIDKITISEIALKKVENKKQDMNQIDISFKAQSDFEKLQKMVQILLNQRRIKTIQTIAILRDEKASSESAQLQVQCSLSGYNQ